MIGLHGHGMTRRPSQSAKTTDPATEQVDRAVLALVRLLGESAARDWAANDDSNDQDQHHVEDYQED